MKTLSGSETTTPPVDPRFVQEIAEQMAVVVESLAEMLTLCHARLPVPPNQKEMLEGNEPYDVATDLKGGIECLVNDTLAHSARILREMGTITDEELARRWRFRPTHVPLAADGPVDGRADQGGGNPAV
jgi:hypothetical protein